MANALYGKGRQAFLDGKIDFDTDNIKCTLIDTADYTVDIDVDQYMNLDTVAAVANDRDRCRGNDGRSASATQSVGRDVWCGQDAPRGVARRQFFDVRPMDGHVGVCRGQACGAAAGRSLGS